jgi:hypothetical protein
VLAAKKQGRGPLTMSDAAGELLADIIETARTIGPLLQEAGKDNRRASGVGGSVKERPRSPLQARYAL